MVKRILTEPIQIVQLNVNHSPDVMTVMQQEYLQELGPNHYFHVVPGVSESSLAAKGGYLLCRGGYWAHVAQPVIAPATLVAVR